MIEPLFEHRLEFAGYRTRVLELEGKGVPLLLLHGYADSADTWRLALDQLARRGQRAVAVDLPGFGRADRLRSDEPILPQLDAFVADAAGYVAGRPRRRLVAVGNSLGGCVSLRLAERHPQRVDGVVAVAPAGLQMSRLLELVQRDPILRSLLGLPSPVPSQVIQAAVTRLYRSLAFAVPSRVDAAVIAAFVAHHGDRGTVAGYLDVARRLVPELREPYQLERIAARVLLIWGDRDRLAFHTGARAILEAVSNSRLELLRGVGHCPQVEVPERFTELLLGFLEAPAAYAA
jgi:pimeloyl-ACP methyl ester carboxylesterase